MGRAGVRKVFLVGLVAGVVGGLIVSLSGRTGSIPSADVYYVGLFLIAAGAVIEVGSWIMAMVGSAVLGHWGWFIVLLVLGVIGVIVPIMIIYSFLGPTSQRQMRQRPVTAA